MTIMRPNSTIMKTLCILRICKMLAYLFGMILANEMKSFLNIRANESHVFKTSVNIPVCGTKLRS